MTKRMLGLLSSLFLLIGITSSASAFGLNNWYFDIDGAAGPGSSVLISETLDVNSPNLVDTDWAPGDTVYNFTNYGVTKFTGHDGGLPFGNPLYELTAIYTFSGAADLTTGSNDFTGGSFDIYSDNLLDLTTDVYGTAGNAANILGADDGTKIASFDVVSGEGSIGIDGLPNGELSITYEATFLETGYFFGPDGTTDLSTLSPIELTLGYSTTNASWVEDMNSDIESELKAYAGYIGDVANDPPADFWLQSGGQFRIDIVPEPTTMMLFGVGLLGIAGISRRRVS